MTDGDASYGLITDKHYETIVSTVKKISGMSSVTDAQRKGLDALLSDIQDKPVKTRHDIIKIADAIDKLGLPEDCQFETGLFYTLGFEASALSAGAHAQRESDNAYLRGKLVNWNTRRIVREIEASQDIADAKKQEHIDYFTQLNPNGPVSAAQAAEIYKKADKRYQARKKNDLPESLLNEVVFFQYIAQSENPANVIDTIVGAPAAAEQKLGIFLDAFERMKRGEAFDPSTLPRELRDDFGRYFAGLSKYIVDEEAARKRIKTLEQSGRQLRAQQRDPELPRKAQKYDDLAAYVTALASSLLDEDTKELKDGSFSVPLYKHNKEDYEENPDEFPGNAALADKRTLSVIVTQLVDGFNAAKADLKRVMAEKEQLSAQHDETKQTLAVAEARASEAEAQKATLQTKYDTDVAAATAKASGLQATLDAQQPPYDTVKKEHGQLTEAVTHYEQTVDSLTTRVEKALGESQ